MTKTYIPVDLSTVKVGDSVYLKEGSFFRGTAAPTESTVTRVGDEVWIKSGAFHGGTELWLEAGWRILRAIDLPSTVGVTLRFVSRRDDVVYVTLMAPNSWSFNNVKDQHSDEYVVLQLDGQPFEVLAPVSDVVEFIEGYWSPDTSEMEGWIEDTSAALQEKYQTNQ